MNTCQICGKETVPVFGPPKSPVLLVGDMPGEEDIREGAPFSGRAGEVLKNELMKVGIQWNRCRSTYMWLHEPKEDELNWHLEQLTKELIKSKLVLLMGSEVIKVLTQDSVSNVYSLPVKSPYIPRDCVAIACYSPGIALHRGTTIGELRLSIEVFAKHYKEMVQ